MSAPKYNLYVNRGGQWLIEKSFSNRDRDKSKAEAQALVGKPGIQGVRVTRETTHGDVINEATIFEDPPAGKAAAAPRQPNANSLEASLADIDNSRSALETVPKPDPLAALFGPIIRVGMARWLHITRTVSLLSAVGLTGLAVFAMSGFGIKATGLWGVFFVGLLLFPSLWLLSLLPRSAKKPRHHANGDNGKRRSARRAPTQKINLNRVNADAELNGEIENEEVDKVSLGIAERLMTAILTVSGPMSNLENHQRLPVLLFSFGALDEMETDLSLPVGSSMQVFESVFEEPFDDCGYDPGIDLHETAVNAGRLAWKTGQGAAGDIQMVLPDLIKSWPETDDAARAKSKRDEVMAVYLYFRAKEPAQSAVSKIIRGSGQFSAQKVDLLGTGVDEGGAFLCPSSHHALQLAGFIGENGPAERWQVGMCGQSDSGSSANAMKAELLARAMSSGEIAADEFAAAPFGREVRSVFSQSESIPIGDGSSSIWVSRGMLGDLVMHFRSLVEQNEQKNMPKDTEDEPEYP